MKGSQEMMYGGTTVSFAAWLAQQDWLVILGTLASVLGLVLTWYFKLKEERRQQQQYELDMRLKHKQLERLEQSKQDFCKDYKKDTDGIKE